MSTRKDLLIIVIILALPAAALAQPGSEPIRTGTCVAEDSVACQAYEYTYSAAGVSCTEECLERGILDACELHNRCTWDPVSRCFSKDVCVESGMSGTCNRWETSPICA